MDKSRQYRARGWRRQLQYCRLVDTSAPAADTAKEHGPAELSKCSTLIVLGGGPAGAVLAARLSVDARRMTRPNDSDHQPSVYKVQSAGLNATAVQNPLTSLADDVAATRRILALQ